MDGVMEKAICWASETDGQRTCREWDGKGECSRDRERRTIMFSSKYEAGFKQVSEMSSKIQCESSCFLINSHQVNIIKRIQFIYLIIQEVF